MRPTLNLSLPVTPAAVADAMARTGSTGKLAVDPDDWAPLILNAAKDAHASTVVTAYASAGPVAAQLARAKAKLYEAGVTLHQVRRPYDDLAWPHATKGFFALKQKIPRILTELGLSA